MVHFPGCAPWPAAAAVRDSTGSPSPGPASVPGSKPTRRANTHTTPNCTVSDPNQHPSELTSPRSDFLSSNKAMTPLTMLEGTHVTQLHAGAGTPHRRGTPRAAPLEDCRGSHRTHMLPHAQQEQPERGTLRRMRNPAPLSSERLDSQLSLQRRLHAQRPDRGLLRADPNT